MRVSFKITVSVLAAMATASPLSCPSATTVTVTLQKTEFRPTSKAIYTTSTPSPQNTASAKGQDFMTIALVNAYGAQLCLSFGSNAGGPSPVGNPPATALPDASSTKYTFPTGWAGRIYVGPNLNPDGSKIEGSFTGPPDIDVSYVDGYSVPITCSSEGIAISGCNIDLFRQPDVTCDNLDGPVCLNSAQNIPNGPSPPFFAACAGAAYTYPNDNTANVSNLGSNLVSCCIGASCEAPSRQLHKRENPKHRDLVTAGDVAPKSTEMAVPRSLLSYTHKVLAHPEAAGLDSLSQREINGLELT